MWENRPFCPSMAVMRWHLRSWGTWEPVARQAYGIIRRSISSLFQIRSIIRITCSTRVAQYQQHWLTAPRSNVRIVQSPYKPCKMFDKGNILFMIYRVINSHKQLSVDSIIKERKGIINTLALYFNLGQIMQTGISDSMWDRRVM